jgi:hypothetical protein
MNMLRLYFQAFAADDSDCCSEHVPSEVFLMQCLRDSVSRLIKVVACAITFSSFMQLAPAQSNQSKSAKGKASSHDLSQESRETIAWISKNYRIDIVWKKAPYPIFLAEERKSLEGINPGADAVEAALPGLRQALAKYPREVPHAAGLSRIILGTKLKASGVHIGGYSNPPSRSLILEIDDAGQQPFKSITMHHEIFHLIDRAILGQFAKQDLGWARLNGPGFKGYQSGDGWKWMANQQPGKGKPPPESGFVSPYSMSSIQEDKAEVFAHLMEDPAALGALAEKDPVIRAKVERMKQLARQASPKMDSKYFDKLAASSQK